MFLIFILLTLHLSTMAGYQIHNKPRGNHESPNVLGTALATFRTNNDQFGLQTIKQVGEVVVELGQYRVYYTLIVNLGLFLMAVGCYIIYKTIATRKQQRRQ